MQIQTVNNTAAHKHQTVKFPIQNIEANLDENALLIGERIFERADYELTQVDRNLWTASIDQFEIEIQLVGSNVRAYSCECTTFEESGICGHIAATLFALRRTLNESKSKGEKRKRKSAQNLSINRMLGAVPPEDLQAFIRQYARKNRLFGLALKVRFASAVPFDDNKAKYNELLDTVLKYLISRQGTISPQGVRHLAGFVEMLNNQADDAIAMEHYTEAFDLLSVALSRLLHISKKCGQSAEELHAAIGMTCLKLKLLALKALSPDLKKELWSFSRAHFPKYSARQFGIAGQLLEVALELSEEVPQREEIVALVGAGLKNPTPVEHKLTMVNSLLPWLARHPAMMTAFGKLLDELEEGPLLLRIAELLLLAALPKESIKVARRALDSGLPVDLHLSLRKTMLSASEQLGSAEEMFEHALWLYYETDDPDYYKICQSVIEKVPKRQFRKIEQDFQFLPGDFLQLTLLALKEDWDQLLIQLKNKDDIDVLIKFAGPLLERRPEETLRLFEGQLDLYLKTHFGPVPIRQLNKWLREIQLHCGSDLSHRLRRFLQVNFPEKWNYVKTDFP